MNEIALGGKEVSDWENDPDARKAVEKSKYYSSYTHGVTSLNSYIEHLQNERHSPNAPYIRVEVGSIEKETRIEYKKCPICTGWAKQEHIERYKTITYAY